MISYKNSILFRLKEEMDMKLKGGLYHQTQIRLAYNSNHMEGSGLTEDQTRSIYETQTIGITEGHEKIDDIIETVNHFRCLDYSLSVADKELSEDIIDFHYKFEKIHRFQDGNGRVGRLIMFKECSKYNIPPFIIEDVSQDVYMKLLKHLENISSDAFLIAP